MSHKISPIAMKDIACHISSVFPQFKQATNKPTETHDMVMAIGLDTLAQCIASLSEISDADLVARLRLLLAKKITQTMHGMHEGTKAQTQFNKIHRQRPFPKSIKTRKI